MLTVEHLKSLLTYDPITGLFVNKGQRGKAKENQILGCINAGGYLRIFIAGKLYYSHRLAWFYMTGVWPDDEIDHMDLNKQNNKWENLREATSSKNSANVHKFKHNTSGYKGVRRHRDKWQAIITVNNECKILGSYVNKEDAAMVYKEAALKHFGEFARLD